MGLPRAALMQDMHRHTLSPKKRITRLRSTTALDTSPRTCSKRTAFGEAELQLVDIYLAQLADPFRVGLLIALLFTAANTEAALNRWIPIALGLVFVAVLIPTAIGAVAGVDLIRTILAVLMAVRAAYLRLTS